MAYRNGSKLIIDKDVRHAFYEYIRVRMPDAMFIHELAFQADKEEGRIDLVAVREQLHGFEIKSDADSLVRVRRQVRIYGKVMNQMSMVVTLRHLKGTLRAIPKYWGVYTYASGTVAEYREPQFNPKTDARSLAGLLWKDSALQLLSDNGLERGFAKKAKGLLHDAIAEQVDFNIIQDAVCRQLKSHRRSI